MTIIRAASLTKSPWKNGGGTTTEIAREGSDAFSWRVSFAEILENGPFSIYPGYDRALVVWQGNGIYLDGETLTPGRPFYFSGELPKTAQLIDGRVTDIGCIYKRSEFICKMTKIEGSPDLAPSTSVNLLFVLKGELMTSEGHAHALDTVRFDKGAIFAQDSLKGQVTPDFQAILISLTQRMV